MSETVKEMAINHDKYDDTPARPLEQLGRQSRLNEPRIGVKYGQENHLNIGFNYLAKYVTRKEWGAAAPKQSTGYLCKPVIYVRLTATRSNECAYKEECAKTLRKLQHYHMENGLCDIPYNFLIGGDNSIYEGRGFLWNPLLEEEFGELQGKVFDVALIGTFQDSDPPSGMMSAAIDVLNACMLKKDLIAKFDLIPFPECRKPILPLFEQEK